MSVSGDIEELANEAMSRFNKRITNEIFLMIQSDRDLMRGYLECVQAHGADTSNRGIGKAVKQRYRLENGAYREHEQSSPLISSHQTFE